MKKHSPKKSLTRREALGSTVALTATTLAACSGEGASPSASPVRLGIEGAPRVAILGGGAGGIMAAYFLHEDCNVEVFESRHKIGGHCDSITFDYQGYPLTVDLGAQFFHPDTHPLYVTLLEEIALFDPEHRDQDETLEAPGGICVFPTGSSRMNAAETNCQAD
jgi:hypothetical protein